MKTFAVPNILSISRIILAPILSMSLYACSKYDVALLILYLIAIATDILDGFVARKTNAATLTGAKLDVMADITLVISAFIPLVIKSQIPLWFLLMAIMSFSVFIKENGKKRMMFDKAGKCFGMGCMSLPGIIIISDIISGAPNAIMTGTCIFLLTMPGCLSIINKLI